MVLLSNVKCTFQDVNIGSQDLDDDDDEDEEDDDDEEEEEEDDDVEKDEDFLSTEFEPIIQIQVNTFLA